MNIKALLMRIGIQSEGLLEFLDIFLTVVIVSLLGWLAYIIVKKWLAKIIMRIVAKTSARWDNLMFDQKFFNRLGVLVAPIVITIVLSTIAWEHMYIIQRIIGTWIVVASVLLVSSILNGINRIYESYPMSRDRPIRVFIQVIMIFVWCSALIVVISIFTGKSPLALLAGLAAFTAVIMLIFQDSILGFVAGIQLSANHMVRIGDWIEMPNRGVDGDVIEINLTTVKVQNFDKTITTVPTHKLVSESFTNWRGMEESKGRRIKRSILINVDSIHYLTNEELEVLRQSSLLNSYMEQKLSDLAEYNANRGNLLDERRLTNIGTFREYLESWIANNPNVNQEMTHMVRQLQPGPTGIPLEIYCFSARQKWVEYERVQADIFDHVYAVLELFNLKPFQYSGSVVAK